MSTEGPKWGLQLFWRENRVVEFRSRWPVQIVLLAVAVALLYGPFLANPLVFDDLGFFQAGTVQPYSAGDAHFGLRWFPYITLGLTYSFVGQDPLWYRVGNLLLHVTVGVSLYALFIQILHLCRIPDRKQSLSAEWLAFFAALAFVLNPVAVYGPGYLIQRSIVMATLFTLLMWLSLLLGLERRGRKWLWLSVGFYFLAVFSKEHAIMAPAVALALVVLHVRRSKPEARPQQWQHEAARLWPVFLLYALIAVFVIFATRGLLGSIYEPHSEEVLEDFTASLDHPYLLSVITQCWQFFKYLLLWLVPNPQWMSIDMREPFAATLTAWPQILGAAGYAVLLLAGARLLWRGGAWGLAGLSLLVPALLFTTEFSTVRIQEQFVLYRSYLWMPLLFGLFPLALQRLDRRLAIALMVVVPAALGALALDRLVTFSNPILLWDDAVRLTTGREHLHGTARTIYIRGYYWNKYSFNRNAIEDFDRALALHPNFPAALKERGRAKMGLGQYNEALADFNRAIQLRPNYNQAYEGRAEVLDALGSNDAARRDYQQACSLGWQQACAKGGKH